MPVKRLSIRQARSLKVLFKRRWILAKLLMTIGGVLFGMLFLEQHMLDALALLENSPSAHEEFAAHRRAIRIGLLGQLALFLAIVSVAVFKPGEK